MRRRAHSLSVLRPSHSRSASDPPTRPIAEPSTAELRPEVANVPASGRLPGDEATPNAELAITAADVLLATDYPAPRWLLAGLLPEGLTVLAGAPKAGKSLMALDVALAVATGGEALGRQVADPGAVLYLALEDTPERLKARMIAMRSEAAAVASADAANLTVDGEDGTDKADASSSPSETFPATNDAHLARLALVTECDAGVAAACEGIAAWLAETPDARLVIVDVLGALRGQTASSFSRDYAELGLLKRLADRHHVAALVLHHTIKGARADPFDAIAGSIGLRGRVDTMLVLETRRSRDQPDLARATLHARGRVGPDLELPLARAPGTLRWREAPAEDEDEAPADAYPKPLSSERLAVLDLLHERCEAMSTAELALALDVVEGTMRKRLFDMVRDGQVERVAPGVFALPLESDDDDVSADPAGTKH